MVTAERRWSSAKVISALADVRCGKECRNIFALITALSSWPRTCATGWPTQVPRRCTSSRALWENGYCECFNSKLRDEFLNGEIFYSIKELRMLAERWRVHYNTVRPHSSLGYRPPAPEAWLTSTRGLPELRDSCATLTHLLVQNIGQATHACWRNAVLPK
jgi:transposase InsO family protein